VWHAEHIVGEAADVHERDPGRPSAPLVWAIEVTSPALVLGSSQSLHDADHDACRQRSVAVARRRSGGGAVLLVPGEVVWVDVIIPAGHETWDSDVVRSSWRLGDVWSHVLAELGIADTDVHRGRWELTEWSRTVCFAGIGPGEVSQAGRKLVGISQRRTRDYARFQCALNRTWRPDRLVELLDLSPEQRDELLALLDASVTTCDLTTDVVVDALLAHLGP
jgi:lipoate---protein ligase